MQPEALSRPELHMHLERNRTMVTTPPKNAPDFCRRAVSRGCLRIRWEVLENTELLVGLWSIMCMSLSVMSL